jgi:hypothetical protein
MDKEITSKIEEAKSLIEKKEFSKSADLYGEALKLAVAKFGEMSLETAPLYYEYGSILLEAAIQTSNIFGTAVERAAERQSQIIAEGEQDEEPDAREAGEEEELEEEEEEEFIDEVSDVEVSEEVVDDEDEQQEQEQIEDDLQEEQDEEEGDTEEHITSGKAEAVLESLNENNGEQDNEEAPEEDDDLQVAWELLETARVIFSKYPEEKLALAKVYNRLGELGMEMDNFEQAEGDFRKCIDIYESIFPSHDRRLATL